MNYVHDKDIAEDLVQEFFIKYWEQHADRPDPDNFKSYAARATKNISIDFIRKRTVQQKREDWLPDLPEAFDPQKDQDDLDQRHARLVRIFELIDDLPQGQKQILKLHALEKLTYAQIAERQGISINTVRTQLTRAYRSLRKSATGLILLSLLKHL
ncbi:sigma-70 family RNA polymerase sigma factor [Pedobacter sp. CYS-01]|uniref:Sigma-70 family RNA polymerase sigma factor n=2 Tax=Pedobacter montanisoli TaxID=2923277 RepID=A0ABS9ZS34_9SPHI|nr:sigma-70 family RNA polymerase sigma factor [Pedobacter montanisoli]